MKIAHIFSTVFAVLFAQSVLAATNHTYDFTYDGSSLVTNQTSAGNALTIGQSVGTTFNALGNDYWTIGANANIWTPIFVSECGTRHGDLTWSFLLDGVAVNSGSLLGASSSCVHIPQLVSTSAAINFDQLHWEYVLTSSTTATNTLGGIFNNSFGALSPAAYVAVPDVDVPEPATLALLGLGILGVAVSRRKKKVA